jgi:hypothetical protein
MEPLLLSVATNFFNSQPSKQHGRVKICGYQAEIQKDLKLLKLQG